MANQESEYKRLRSFLNPAIKGKNADAVLKALANGTSYLLNNIEAVNDNLFITTASAQYLDLLLSQYGITRPPAVGVSDEVFREIGLQVKNRKQVRDLISNILDIIFGDEFARATNISSMLEPYNLADGDTLIISYDGSSPVTITFKPENFSDITNATAIEVANAIVSYLVSQNLKGLATTKNNGIGNYVELVSGTIGPRSSVTVLGGSAQNKLIFPSTVPAGGNGSTQWNLSLQADGRMRFTWTAGADPNLGKLSPGNYVNIYGGGFASSSNVGTFTIVNAKGGTAGNSYFEIYNPIGTTGNVVQTADDAVLFFDPVKKTLQSNGYYAALYQTETNVVQVFLPATTKVVRRGRIGSSHLHDPPRGTFTFLSQPSSGDSFSITSAVSLIAGTNFAIGATIAQTVENMVNAIGSLYDGLVAVANVIDGKNSITIYNNSLSNILTISYSGSQSIEASGPEGDMLSLQPNQEGPYIYDTAQTFTVAAVHTNLLQEVNPSSGRVVLVQNSGSFPNSSGYVIFDYGGPTQEMAAYIATPSSNSILLAPTTNLGYIHPVGQEVRLIESKAPVSLPLSGTGFEYFLTDVVSGRVYCQDLVRQVAAAGISLVFTILYPNDIGLGKAKTSNSEITYVYGP